jgi:glucose/arabinose dehydrogenase/fibronectin type 3 domain-containing protein
MRPRRTSRQLVVVISLVAGLFSFPGPAAADTFTGPGFATERVATLPPFTLVGIAFAPDGRLFVWQKNGVVRVIKNGQLLPTPFIDLSAKVNTFDDRGFWGLAFDPQFDSNGRVYMSYTFENAGNPNSSSARTSRITRVTADPANPDTALPGSEQVVLGSVGTPPCSAQPAGADCISADGGSHTLGSLHFAGDGTLFVGIGDGAEAGPSDPNPLRAQDLNSPNGKILRIRPDGSAPSDNPFYDGTNSWRSRVWQFGVRNPFGFSQHPDTDELYLGDVGWNTWEEVDHGPPGANFGWPCFEGTGPQPTYQSQFAQCAGLPASSVTPPFFTYDRSIGAAVIGGPFYTGTLYPQQYWGSFFFADYPGGWIRHVVFDSDHRPVSVQTFATGIQDPVALTLGPDGMIYYLSFTTGEVRRIRYNGPVAAAAATPTYGYSPLSVSFSSAGSVNAGGGQLTYLWEFGDGTTSTVANPSHTYTTATVKTFAARLTVTNASGLSSSDVVQVTVGSVPPTPTISAPTDGTTVIPGQTIDYGGSATDPEDGALPASALRWTVLLHHNTHVHTFVGGTGAQGSFVAEDHGPVGTFSYEIILTATDSSGLKASTSVTLPVGSDTSPPTDPTGLTASAAGLSQVNLDWLASTDNVGVTGYRVERCQGQGCTNFAEVASPTATSYSDNGLSASTTYRYRVRAVDPSGNRSGYSGVAEATTDTAPPTPPGLVGAWAFGEGAGTTTADASGNGNVGTLTGASWSTQGRFGKALSFNGANSLVRVASAASLNVTSAMTLSAWIQPTSSQSGWRTIMQRETDAYFLNASSSSPMRPAGGGTFGGSSDYLSGPTANPVNTWTHVALTYDSIALRLYVNGAQVATAARTGAVQTSTNPLWIGGNNPYGEYFQGLIDEVRVYNRALTQADIQTDMNTSIVPTAPDTTAPSTPSGLNAATVSASQINLSWTASTDNVGVAGYRVERCAGTGCTNFAEVAVPAATTFNNTGLAPSTVYRYRIRAADLAGNLSPYSTIATGTTSAGTDTTPPSAPTAPTATAVSTTRLDLAWAASSDNVGVTEYRVERCQGSSCTNFAQVGTTPNTNLSSTGLAANTVYRFRVRAADAAGNLSPYSAIVSGRTLAADTTRPTAPTGLTANAVSPTQVNLGWTASTDNVGVTGYRVERCQGAGCTTWAEIASTSTTSHSDTGRLPGTVYRYRVRAMDAAGNLSLYSSIATVTTPAVTDGSPPSAPAGLTAAPVGSGQVNLGWAASTDNVGVAGYRVERCAGTGCTNFAQVASPSTTSYSDNGLSASTTYRYRVRAADAAGNLSGYSNVAEATTGAASPSPGGLVGAWAFGEGAGTTTADATGNGNVGTLTGASWSTQGRYGSALSFNGTNSVVRVASAASLNVTSAMTLSAWIQPTASQSGWRTIMQREADAYFLNASNSSPMRPSGGGTFGGSLDYLSGPTANPVNTWTHVALTYDGTILRLYVNGTQVATAARTGAVQTTTNPLWIGGNNPYGEYFQGLIDEVRVYNRALTQTDIQADMNSPLNWTGLPSLLF